MNYDRRCPAKEFCWYCKDRCDLCMIYAGFGFAKPVVGLEGIHKFCSEDCAIAAGSTPLPPVIDFWDPTQNPPAPFSRTCALSDNHKELLYIFSQFTSTRGYQSFDITLCKGDGGKQFAVDKVYAVCYTRRGIRQLLFGFFLTEDLGVHEIVKLSECDREPPEEFKASAHTILEMIIKKALDHKAISNITALLELNEGKGRIDTKQLN